MEKIKAVRHYNRIDTLKHCMIYGVITTIDGYVLITENPVEARDKVNALIAEGYMYSDWAEQYRDQIEQIIAAQVRVTRK